MIEAVDQQTYAEQGFIILREFLDGALMAELNQQLSRYINDVVPQLADSDAFYEDRSRPETLKQLNRMDSDAFFREYATHPHWQTAAQTLVGEAVLAGRPEWFNKPPCTRHVTPPHQDNYYFCLAPPHVVTIWLALDDVDVENGCLRYVAGSHRGGYRPHAKSRILGFSQGITDYSADDFVRETAVILKAGDAVAHHGMTIHRADANHSTTRHRRSFAMVFQGQSCERDPEAFARYQQSARQQHQEMGLQT